MAKYEMYRDDYEYPIEADTLEEMQDLRKKKNRRFISHWYGTVALCYDERGKATYVDIYTGEQVPASKRCW